MSITRYDPVGREWGDDMRETETGEFVRYEDHLYALAALKRPNGSTPDVVMVRDEAADPPEPQRCAHCGEPLRTAMTDRGTVTSGIMMIRKADIELEQFMRPHPPPSKRRVYCSSLCADAAQP